MQIILYLGMAIMYHTIHAGLPGNGSTYILFLGVLKAHKNYRQTVKCYRARIRARKLFLLVVKSYRMSNTEQVATVGPQMVGGIHYWNKEAAATSHNHTYCALYPSLHLPQLNKTIKVKAYFTVLIPKGSAIGETLQQSLEVSLQNMHSIDHMVRKAIKNFIPTTLQQLVCEICKIWQNHSVINDSLVNYSSAYVPVPSSLAFVPRFAAPPVWGPIKIFLLLQSTREMRSC